MFLISSFMVKKATHTQTASEIPVSPRAGQACAVTVAPGSSHAGTPLQNHELWICHLPVAVTYQSLRVHRGLHSFAALQMLLKPNTKLSFLAQSYEAAVTLDPDQAQAWMNMGGIRHIQVSVALTVFSSTLV